VGTVEVILDTARFVGKRVRSLYVEVENGKKSAFKLTVSANSQLDPTRR
jgi:hypothetical protein